jgi:hypothetical protein
MLGHGIAENVVVNGALFFCPLCKGQILPKDSANANSTVRRSSGGIFYCLLCEMFVAPCKIAGPLLRATR